MADDKPMVLGGTAIKPKERHGWEKIRYILHNPETGEILTRTPKSWALITGFYIIYYSCLAGFWLAMLNIFFLTLSDNEPKWLNENGLIGKSPGLGLKPGQIDKLIDSSMIAYNMGKGEDQGKPGDANYIAGTDGWVERITEFLDPYVNCDSSKTDCFDISNFGDCADAKTKYGFTAGKPCVYLKLNKIFDLTNENYLSEEELPKDMPDTLKAQIKTAGFPDQTWVECHGEYPADVEALKGLKYFPVSQGFAADRFPYMGKTQSPAYQSPLIAVQFADVAKNQLLHVECRAWAKNIGYSKRDRIGINHLELLILDDKAAKNVGKT
jgi:sodium/potassium-transporting ATPase subunit beta